MNVFHKVTLASLRKNKTRTIVTIIGIILSAAMICAVTTSVSSLQDFLIKNYEYTYGAWHGGALNISRERLEYIQNSPQVQKVVYSGQVGYARIDSENEYKPYLYIVGASEDFEKMMPVHITSGTYPANPNEILLPLHVLSNGGLTCKIGDTMTLEVGKRVSEGFLLGQNNPYPGDDDNTETIEDGETKTYTVVGFYERPSFEDYSAPGYTAITVADTDLSRMECFEAYFTMHNAKDVFSFMEENQLPGLTNSNLLLFLGASRYNSYQTMLYSLVSIVMARVMVGCVWLFYNAFSISVSERTKQFGLLSSIGATRKQLRRMVLFEAFTVGIVGIPIGIAAGVGGIAVTLHFIGEKFMTSFGMHYPMQICVSPASIVLACTVALVTVLISAWIPSKRAMRVSAVEAIKQSGDIKVKAKAVKTSKLTYKLFGLPGVIASKHFKRNRKKYRATVLSLFMSIVLFVSSSAFSGYLMESMGEAYRTKSYDIRFIRNSDKTDSNTPAELVEMIRNEGTVIEAAYTQSDLLSCVIKKDHLTDKWLQNNRGGSRDPSMQMLDVVTVFVEDGAYRNYLKSNGLDEELYMRTESPVAVAIDGQTHFVVSEEKFVKFNALKDSSCDLAAEMIKPIPGYYYHSQFYDENGNLMCRFAERNNEESYIDVPRSEAFITVPLKIGTTLYEDPYFVDSHGDLVMLYPESARNSVIPQDDVEKSYSVMIRSSNHTATYDAVKKILMENGINYDYLYDYAAEVQQQRDLITIIQVFSYGFIVLISLIAAANVFNTISTNINLRRREFAMLKSVGMTSKGFNKMMNYECLLYGAKALLYGLPVSIGITFLIYLSVQQGVTVNFRLPWTAIGIAVLSVFAVVFATMMYAMRKIKKDNPIDALKNENL